MSSAVTSFDGIKNGVQDYWNELPEGKTRTAFISGVSSFTLSVLLSGGNVLAGAVGGVFAIVASFVESMAKPLFDRMFNAQTSPYFSFCMRKVIVLSAVALTAPIIGNILGITLQINFVLSLLFSCGLGYVFSAYNDEGERDLNNNSFCISTMIPLQTV